MTKVNIIAATPANPVSYRLQWVALSLALVALITTMVIYRPSRDIQKQLAMHKHEELNLATDIQLTELNQVERLVKAEAKIANTPVSNFKKESPYKKQIKAPIYERYKKIIDKAAKTYGLEPSFITAVIWQESRGNPKAISKAGAVGLMQLMPATAKSLGVNPYDPVQNVMGGSKYLSIQLKRFGTKEKALAAYNAGPGNVKHYKRIKETREYVPRILAYEKQITKTV